VVHNISLATILKEAMAHLAPEALQRDVTLALDATADVVIRANPEAASRRPFPFLAGFW